MNLPWPLLSLLFLSGALALSSSNRIHTDTAHFLSPREEHSLATPATLAGSLGRRQDLNFFPFRQHYQQHQAEEEERARARRVPVVIRVSLTARMSLHVNVLGGFEIDDELRERARAEPELPRALAMGFLAHMQRTIERGLAGQNVHIRAREPRPMFERIGEGDGLMLGGEWATEDGLNQASAAAYLSEILTYWRGTQLHIFMVDEALQTHAEGGGTAESKRAVMPAPKLEDCAKETDMRQGFKIPPRDLHARMEWLTCSVGL